MSCSNVNNANHNIIIFTITLLLISYNIIATAITNFGNTMQNMLAMQRNSAKVIYHSCLLERELPLMDRFSLCLNKCLLTHTQRSITDSMDTVKISQRFACANEQSK